VAFFLVAVGLVVALRWARRRRPTLAGRPEAGPPVELWRQATKVPVRHEGLRPDVRGITPAPGLPEALTTPPGEASGGYFAGVSAVCFLLVTALTLLNEALVWLLIDSRVLHKNSSLDEPYPLALALATLWQAGLFGALWLPLCALTRRWPDRSRCLATADLTVANLGAWLGLNVFAGTRDLDAVCLAVTAPGGLLWGLWLFRRKRPVAGGSQ
jgi:hypothetical protein